MTPCDAYTKKLEAPHAALREMYGAWLTDSSVDCLNDSTLTWLFHIFKGVLEEDYVNDIVDDNYFSSITEEMNTTWKNEHNGTSVKESLRDYLVEYMGKPMDKLLG